MFQKVVFLFVLLSVSTLAFGQSKRTISATPPTFDFGGVVLGATAAYAVTLSNTGTMSLKISSVSSASEDFAFAGVATPVSLASGASVQLTITFVPQVAGVKTGSITVVSNAQNSPTVITVSGSAAAPVAPVAPLSISTNSLPAATVGTAYSAGVSGTGGKSPYAWMITFGVLPNGLTLASDSGAISGPAVAAGTSTFTVALSDAAGTTIAQPLTITVNPAATAAVGGTMWSAIQGKPYAYALAPPAGAAPFTWSVVSGSLPPGLSLDTSRGTIQGTPSADGTYPFSVQVRDTGTVLVTENFNLIVSSSSAAYGNVGNAYATEGGTPDPTAIMLTACQATTLQSNQAYRLGQNLIATTPGTICFIPNAGTKIDLGGFTLTGRIAVNANINGIAIFNGTINCTWADSGSNAGCVRLISTSPVTSPLRVHHLNLTNNGIPSRSMHIEWNVAAKFPGGVSVRVYNITALVPSQPLVGRSFALSIIATNQTPEFFSNDLTCAADAAACQGIMCYGTGECKFHHNRISLIFNTTAESGRALLFDGGVPSGEAWNNEIIANNSRAIRVRDSANIRIHDNRILNIQPNGAGTIHLADPVSTVTNDLNTLVDNNDFEMAGGTVVFIRNGINAKVRNNRFTCVGDCSTSRLAYVRSPLTLGSTFSELTVENNPDVSLYLGAPQNRVDAGGVLNLCNSGQTSGLGVTNNVACSP